MPGIGGLSTTQSRESPAEVSDELRPRTLDGRFLWYTARRQILWFSVSKDYVLLDIKIHAKMVSHCRYVPGDPLTEAKNPRKSAPSRLDLDQQWSAPRAVRPRRPPGQSGPWQEPSRPCASNW
jgi:hypothetical protein